MTAKKDAAQPILDEAAEVRQLAVKAIGISDRGMGREDLYEALIVATRLEPGRARDAMFAHGVMRRVIQEELAQSGLVEEPFAELFNALYGYIHNEGYQWEDDIGVTGDGFRGRMSDQLPMPPAVGIGVPESGPLGAV